jgi:D-proline reductase (dithiol) PrdB
MEPVRYVERLNERYRSQGFPPYQWSVNDPTPFTPLRKDHAESRVGLLSSGGVSQTCAAAWDADARNDFRLDEIPADAPADGFQVHDSYYDTASATEDINCIFPVDRLRELAAEGFVGSVAPRLWSGFMGRIYKRSHVTQVAAPAFREALAADDVDLVVLVPA